MGQRWEHARSIAPASAACQAAERCAPAALRGEECPHIVPQASIWCIVVMYYICANFKLVLWKILKQNSYPFFSLAFCSSRGQCPQVWRKPLRSVFLLCSRSTGVNWICLFSSFCWIHVLCLRLVNPRIWLLQDLTFSSALSSIWSSLPFSCWHRAGSSTKTAGFFALFYFHEGLYQCAPFIHIHRFWEAIAQAAPLCITTDWLCVFAAFVFVSTLSIGILAPFHLEMHEVLGCSFSRALWDKGHRHL